MGFLSLRSSVVQDGGDGLPTVTYDLATEPNGFANGHDGNIAWQSVFLMNDGRVASFGTGNHAPDQTNAMKAFNPVTEAVDTIFPWTQDEDPPRWTEQSPGNHGNDLYVSNYDNHPSIYIPSENKAVWFGNGVFDFAEESWTYGDRSPNTDAYDDFVAELGTPLGSIYNPVVGWCSALDCGVFYGASDGGSGSPTNLILLERQAGSPGWKLTATDMSGQGCAAIHLARNNGAVIGEYFYFGGKKQSDESLVFYKVHILTKTLTETLMPWSAESGEHFPQLVYDSARQKLVLLGIKVQEYDLADDEWTDKTPIGWVGYIHAMGIYHPDDNCIYFRGWPSDEPGTTVESFRWHKMVFPLASQSRYTEVVVDSGANPFNGPPESEFGGAKHVFWQWDPILKRVYTYGGDYSSGSGAYSYAGHTMGGGGASIVTYDPVDPETYTRQDSFCGDMYSIDPYEVGPGWRLEEPYFPRNISSTVQDRPPRTCQKCLVWDSNREKYWSIISFVRDVPYLDGGVLDPWGNGTLTASPPDPTNAAPAFEHTGTYSWLPGATGVPGDWTFETTARLLYRQGATTGYSVDDPTALITGLGDERIGYFCYDPVNDVIIGMGNNALIIFDPATKTYEYRTLNPAGYTYFITSTACCACIDGQFYCVVAAQASGVSTSRLLKINVADAVALSNAGAITNYSHQVLPFSISDEGVWESSNDYAAKWQEEVGVIAVARKLLVVGAYRGVVNGGENKIVMYDPDADRFTDFETPPFNFQANSWVALPDTGEALVGLGTNGGPNNKLMRCRVI